MDPLKTPIGPQPVKSPQLDSGTNGDALPGHVLGKIVKDLPIPDLLRAAAACKALSAATLGALEQRVKEGVAGCKTADPTESEVTFKTDEKGRIPFFGSKACGEFARAASTFIMNIHIEGVISEKTFTNACLPDARNIFIGSQFTGKKVPLGSLDKAFPGVRDILFGSENPKDEPPPDTAPPTPIHFDNAPESDAEKTGALLRNLRGLSSFNASDDLRPLLPRLPKLQGLITSNTFNEDAFKLIADEIIKNNPEMRVLRLDAKNTEPGTHTKIINKLPGLSHIFGEQEIQPEDVAELFTKRPWLLQIFTNNRPDDQCPIEITCKALDEISIKKIKYEITSQITSLNLLGCRIPPKFLKNLSHALADTSTENIKRLSLFQSEFLENSLKDLDPQILENLELVDVSSTVGLDPSDLNCLTNLQHLRADNCAWVNDDWLKSMEDPQKLPKLKSLMLSHEAVSKAGCEQFEKSRGNIEIVLIGAPPTNGQSGAKHDRNNTPE